MALGASLKLDTGTQTLDTRELLLRRMSRLLESSQLLRGQLQSYERTMDRIAKHVEAGAPAMSAGEDTDVAGERRRVTETIEQFEASRHQVRLSLMALCREEGASISDVGRMLGISRQLASRLAAEADQEAR